MDFYNYIKQPKHIRLARKYVECFEVVNALSPFTTENYLSVLDSKTKELKKLENQLRECGGSVVSGVVSFNNKVIKKFIRRSPK
jgi:hypothetical protein